MTLAKRPSTCMRCLLETKATDPDPEGNILVTCQL